MSRIRSRARAQCSTTSNAHRKRFLAAAVAAAGLTLGSLVVATPAQAATSDGNPIGGLVEGVTGAVGAATGTRTPTPRRKAPTSVSHAPTRSTGAGGRGSAGPAVPQVPTGSSSGSHAARSDDHASGSVVHTGGPALPPVVVSGTSTRAYPHGSTARAKLLAIGDYTLIGSDADSDGDGTGHGPVPANSLCVMSGGLLCASVLYADSSAAASGGTSSARSRTGVADACVAGDDASGKTCNGVRVGVARSESRQRTAPDGTRSSTSSGSLADLCAEQDGSCLLGGSLLGSSSASGTGAGPARKPTLVSLLVGDDSVNGPDDPIHTQVTKGCDPEVVCSTLNDKHTRPGSDDSGSAADLTGLDDTVGAGVGNSDTGSSATRPTQPTQPAPGSGSGKQGGSAKGTLGDVGLGSGEDRQPLVGLSDNRSSGDRSETRGDATLLSLLGHDVIASHADSDGSPNGHGPVPDNPLCASTDGALCLDLLYADSSAAKSDGSSRAATRTGVADACVAGHDHTGRDCDGLELGIGQGASSLTNDGSTGVTRSSSSTALADLCLHTGAGCALSGDALASRAAADSSGHRSQDSSIADLGADGQQVGAPADPIDLAVPGRCTGDNLACLFLNQVGAGADHGATTAGATVVGVDGLGGTAAATGSDTEVSATGGQPGTVEPPGTEPPGTVPPGTTPPGAHTPGTIGVDAPTTGGSVDGVAASSTGSAPAGVLPDTGGVAAGVLVLGGLLVTAGGGLLTARRRRVAP